jgi:hypothetical protein
MSPFTPSPEFDYYYKACRKGDPGAKAVAVLAAARGLPRDNFEIHEISKAEFEGR